MRPKNTACVQIPTASLSCLASFFAPWTASQTACISASAVNTQDLDQGSETSCSCLGFNESGSAGGGVAGGGESWSSLAWLAALGSIARQLANSRWWGGWLVLSPLGA